MTESPSLIRVVGGTGTGTTAVSSYDSALASAGVHNYNLVEVSSVIPPATTVDVVGTAPDLGRAGNQLVVVQSRATTEAGGVTAGLGWTFGDGFGVFYEANGEIDEVTVRSQIEAGLTDARLLRGWSAGGIEMEVVRETVSKGFVTAVVLGVFGESQPLM